MPRHFRLEEARSLLPTVGRTIREAVQAKGRYQQAAGYLQDLSQKILMLGGVSIDTTVAEAWKNQRDANETALKAALGKMEELGVLVKDLDVGLVDFPTLYRGEEVLLCWRMDESDIAFWHGLSEGFAGRREIDREFREHHRGGDPD